MQVLILSFLSIFDHFSFLHPGLLHIELELSSKFLLKKFQSLFVDNGRQGIPVCISIIRVRIILNLRRFIASIDLKLKIRFHLLLPFLSDQLTDFLFACQFSLLVKFNRLKTWWFSSEPGFSSLEGLLSIALTIRWQAIIIHATSRLIREDFYRFFGLRLLIIRWVELLGELPKWCVGVCITGFQGIGILSPGSYIPIFCWLLLL